MRSIGVLAVALLVAPITGAEERVVVLVEKNPQLVTPFGLDFLSDGSLVVADLGGHRVCKVTRNGQLSVLAGAGTKGHRDGSAAKALFNAPHTVAVQPNGDVLVADTLNHCIRRIDCNGKVFTIAGAPEAGFAGDDGPAGAARFKETFHVCVTPAGYLVADLGNRRIRIREAGGQLFPLADSARFGRFPQLSAKKAPLPKSMPPKIKYPASLPEIRVSAPGRGSRPSVPSQRGWHSGTVRFRPIEKKRVEI